MAPVIGITIPYLTAGRLGLGFSRESPAPPAADPEELRLRNIELEREVREWREREEVMRQDLERTKGRLIAAEEAEERLCAQLGELEAEGVEQATAYNRRIKELSDRLAEAQRRNAASGGKARIDEAK